MDFNGDLLTRCGQIYLRALSAKQPGDPVFKVIWYGRDPVVI